MARIRTLKPEIWMSAQVMNLSIEARLLFIGLITQADDEGRGSAEPRRLKASIFGGDDITSESVRRWLDELVAQQLIHVYVSEQHGALFTLLTWKHHQKIDKPKPSGYPAPPIRGGVVDVSATSRRGSEGSEGSSGGRDRIVPQGSSREAEPVDNGDNSKHAAEGNGEDLPGKSSPPEDPQSRRNGSNGERRNGDFEAINDGVSKLLAAGVVTLDKPSEIARLLHVSTSQVEVAIRQLRDRGRLPAVAA